MLLPLLAAVRATQLNIKRACLEDGKPIIYAYYGSNLFDIDAFVEAGSITVSVVSYLPGRTADDTQKWADKVKDRIVAELPKQIDRLSEKPKEAGK